MKKNKINTVLKFILCMFIINDYLFAYSQENKSVTNILTWWGYLDNIPPEMKKNIEKECNTTISYDDYDSNEEFTDRFNNPNSHYDIMIFSDSVYKSVEKNIHVHGSNLYLKSNEYNPIIKNQYIKSKFPHNVVYFVHSLTGFLYNPNLININSNNNLKDIFKNAKDNIVIMIDDPLEANYLIGLLLNNNSKTISNSDKNYLTWENYQTVFQNTHTIITNSPEKISTLENFAFAFQWSGDAFNLMEKNNNSNKLKFLVHPKLSYISTDLLAELNTTEKTNCVAKSLLNKDFLSYIQNTNKYFSPYGEDKNITDPVFKNFLHETYKALPNLPWINSNLTKEQLEKLKNSWEYIRFKSSEQEKKHEDK